MWRTVVTGLFCLCIASGCKTEEERCIEAGGEILDARELRKLYPGNTMSGVIPAFNVKFHVFYEPGGVMMGTAFSGVGTDTDRGHYVIKKSGELCTRWNKWQSSGCAPVYRHGDEYKIFNPAGGALLATQRLRKGNPEKLGVQPAGAPPPASPPPGAPEADPAP
jgi:hypothetical protein